MKQKNYARKRLRFADDLDDLGRSLPLLIPSGAIGKLNCDLSSFHGSELKPYPSATTYAYMPAAPLGSAHTKGAMVDAVVALYSKLPGSRHVCVSICRILRRLQTTAVKEKFLNNSIVVDVEPAILSS